MTKTPPQPEIPATPVTLLDIYTRQVEMDGRLAVIHEQLKAIPDHESRIRRLEETRARIYGGAFAISVVTSALAGWFGPLISRR
jgi:hypothetical protein